MTTNKDTRGGARPGSGAPTKDPELLRVKYSVRIPKWMADQLDAMLADTEETRADIVERALLRTYKPHLTKP